MYSHAIPRVLYITLAITLVTTFAGFSRASAKGAKDWTDTLTREDIPVQACAGFDISTNYTTVRKYHVIEDNTGEAVTERRTVIFVGSVVNAMSGQSLLFSGGFTRTADYDQEYVAISDLNLKLDPPGRTPVTISIVKLDHDLIDNPRALLLEFTPAAVPGGLCGLLGGEPPRTTPQSQVPDTCDTTRSGKPC